MKTADDIGVGRWLDAVRTRDAGCAFLDEKPVRWREMRRAYNAWAWNELRGEREPRRSQVFDARDGRKKAPFRSLTASWLALRRMED